MWWNLQIVRLEPQPNKNTKEEANKQKPNRIASAQTAADSDKMPKVTTSSHHMAKPPVTSRFSWTANLHVSPLLFDSMQTITLIFLLEYCNAYYLLVPCH